MPTRFQSQKIQNSELLEKKKKKLVVRYQDPHVMVSGAWS